jgi:site-specific DNA-methyltransferase (adenine-specific)
MINLIQGDCLEVMRDMADGSVDIVISDIPYGIDFSEWDVLHDNKNSALLGASPAQNLCKLFKTRGKPLNGWSAADKERGKEFQRFYSEWLLELYRITKPCSQLLLLCGRQLQHRFTCSAEDVGFVFKDCITWNKQKAPFRAQRVNNILTGRGLPNVSDDIRLGNLSPMCEPIVWMFRPYKTGTTITDSFIESGLGCFNSSAITSNILNISSKVPFKQHETQKPVELMTALIKLVSSENHTIFDPFMGSGTTGVAAKKLNRRFIGIELNADYFKIAEMRIAAA